MTEKEVLQRLKAKPGTFFTSYSDYQDFRRDAVLCWRKQGKTFREIGELLSLTRSRARAIYVQAKTVAGKTANTTTTCT